MNKYGLRIDNTSYWFTDKTKLLEFISMLIDGDIIEVDYNGKEKKAHTKFHLLKKPLKLAEVPRNDTCTADYDSAYDDLTKD